MFKKVKSRRKWMNKNVFKIKFEYENRSGIFSYPSPKINVWKFIYCIIKINMETKEKYIEGHSSIHKLTYVKKENDLRRSGIRNCFIESHLVSLFPYFILFFRKGRSGKNLGGFFSESNIRALINNTLFFLLTYVYILYNEHGHLAPATK